jgi:carbamoyl-phosphate synthase large subunit
MKSTGEVMGIDADFGLAFAKSQLASGTRLPQSGCVFISVRNRDKPAMTEIAKLLIGLGFHILATRGTALSLSRAGLEVEVINKVLEGRPHILDAMKDDRVQLVFNTTKGAKAIEDSYTLRRTALTVHIPYYTTVSGARAAVAAIEAVSRGTLEVAPLQSYFTAPFQ